MGRARDWLRRAAGWVRRDRPTGETAEAEGAAHVGPAAAAAVAALPAARQAVILVHGMGEKIPMDTIKGFVRTVWEQDDDITATGLPNSRAVWSRPDERTGSLELRRITTRESVAAWPSFPDGVRTDFYELYWADLTAGSTWQQFTAWVKGLLWRWPWRVPRDVRGAWVLLWIATLVVLALGVIGFIPDAWWRDNFPPWLPQNVVVGLFALAAAGLHWVATRSFGRVVKYTRADPDNIAARAAVRERGLDLLRALHADATYARVVLVGHSLGAILAYDLISYFWAAQREARTVRTGTREFDALRASRNSAWVSGFPIVTRSLISQRRANELVPDRAASARRNVRCAPA